MESWTDKKVGETLDYSLDWKYRIPANDSIQTSSWTVTANLSISANTLSSKRTTIWLSGGTAGNYANVTNTIVTAQGRTFIESLRLKIV